MKQSAAVPVGSSRGTVVFMVAILAAGAACSRAGDRSSDTGQAVDTTATGAAVDEAAALALAACNPPAEVSAATHPRVVTWAQSLSYAPRPDTGGPNAYGWESVPGARVQLHATTDNRRFSRQALRRGCLIGRLISNRADAGLGVTADTNYIWLDSTAQGFRALVIPRRASAPLKILSAAVLNRHVRPSAEYIVRKPMCMPCGSDWCYAPRDTLRSESMPSGGMKDTGARLRDPVIRQ